MHLEFNYFCIFFFKFILNLDKPSEDMQRDVREHLILFGAEQLDDSLTPCSMDKLEAGAFLLKWYLKVNYLFINCAIWIYPISALNVCDKIEYSLNEMR